MQLNGIGSMFREHNNESRINYLHATQMEWGTAFCRTLMYIPVVLVLGIIAMAWYSYVFVLHDLSFLPGILFSIPIALITISYIRCVLTDNSVPLSQPPPGATLCYKCDRVRPERTHHCSLCGTCQLKMDHHCPWLGNCVGFRNHKYFILFLSYGALTAFIYCATSVGSLSDALFSKGHERSFIVLFTSIIVFAFGITLFPFSGFHIYLVLINSTTLEFGYIRGDVGIISISLTNIVFRILMIWVEGRTGSMYLEQTRYCGFFL